MLNPILKMMAQRSGANQCHTSHKWHSWHPNPSIWVLDLPVTFSRLLLRVHCRAEQPWWRYRARKKSGDGTAWRRMTRVQSVPRSKGTNAAQETAEAAWSDK